MNPEERKLLEEILQKLEKQEKEGVKIREERVYVSDSDLYDEPLPLGCGCLGFILVFLAIWFFTSGAWLR